MKHDNQINIKDWSQDRISDKTIFIGGAGATGSISGLSVARLGVAKIIQIDHDSLEKHNLENQMYTRNDIGKSKVSALKSKVKEIDENIEFIGLQKEIQDISKINTSANIYLGCFDNFGARYYLNMLAVTNKVPFIDVGIQDFTITLRTIFPPKTSCMECWPSLIPEARMKASCSDNSIPSTFVTAMQASTLQVTQMIKLIFNWEYESYIYFNLKNGVFSKIELERNPNCSLCSGVN
jgi:adenylyltransferase/sulfurtransferase